MLNRFISFAESKRIVKQLESWDTEELKLKLASLDAQSQLVEPIKQILKAREIHSLK